VEKHGAEGIGGGMRPPREIACELVEDFWNKGGECTREYAQERIVAALKAVVDECARVLREGIREEAESAAATALLLASRLSGLKGN
jgi:hypothetical protein